MKYFCATCGSDEILHDAWAIWNEETEQFEVSSVQDMEYCTKCDGECKTIFGNACEPEPTQTP